MLVGDRIVGVDVFPMGVDFARLAIPRCTWLVALGDKDDLVNHESVLDWTRAVHPAPEVKILAGAEHFFHGRLTELRTYTGGWLAARLAGNP